MTLIIGLGLGLLFDQLIYLCAENHGSEGRLTSTFQPRMTSSHFLLWLCIFFLMIKNETVFEKKIRCPPARQGKNRGEKESRSRTANHLGLASLIYSCALRSNQSL